MSDPESPQNPIEQKLPNKSQLYEHLFPGRKFKDLPLFNPANISGLIKRLMVEGDVEHAQIAKAIQAQQGYASRHNFPFPDQLSTALELKDTMATPENVSRFRGWISDLLSEDERLGGMGIRSVAYIPEELMDQWVDAMMPINMLNPLKSKDSSVFWKTAQLRVIGVTDAAGKPKAVITMMEGPRPDSGKKVSNPSFSLSNALPQGAAS